MARNRLGVRGVAALLSALGRAETHTLTALDLSHNDLWLEAGMNAAAAAAAAGGVVSSDALAQLGVLLATPGCVLQLLNLSCTGLLAAAEGEAAPHARGGSVALLAAALRVRACPLRSRLPCAPACPIRVAS